VSTTLLGSGALMVGRKGTRGVQGPIAWLNPGLCGRSFKLKQRYPILISDWFSMCCLPKFQTMRSGHRKRVVSTAEIGRLGTMGDESSMTPPRAFFKSHCFSVSSDEALGFKEKACQYRLAIRAVRPPSPVSDLFATQKRAGRKFQLIFSLGPLEWEMDSRPRRSLVSSLTVSFLQ
jgi:hypothetical protein